MAKVKVKFDKKTRVYISPQEGAKWLEGEVELDETLAKKIEEDRRKAKAKDTPPTPPKGAK